VKLLLDEMLPAVIAEQLRSHGHDAVAVDELAALRGLPDAELFAHAQQDGRIVVTYNRHDFLALDRDFRSRGHEHHGVVILHPGRFPQGAGSIGPLVTSLGRLLEREPPYPSFVHWLQ